MPLTEEEKQALREKYRRQRQAMWEGKSQSRESSQDEVQFEQRQTASDNGSERPADTASTPPDAQDSAVAEGDSIGVPSSTQSGPSTPSASDDKRARQSRTAVEEPPSHIHNVTVELIPPAELPEAPDSSPAVEGSAIPHSENQPHIVEEDSASAEGAGRPQSRSTARVQLSKDGVTTYVKPSESPKTEDNGQQFGKQIREQREKLGAEQSSSRSPAKQQEAEPLSDDEKDSGILNWKLVLGVVGTIIVLTGVGILLGYWFAS
jgi:hypothetical protein